MEVKSAHTRLFVSDLATCAEFYRDIMKFKTVTLQIDKGYAEFEIAHNMRMSLFRQQEMSEILRTSELPASAECQDKVGLILHVHDLDGIYSELRHAKVEFAEPPTQNKEFALKVAYCRDPEGHLIGLFESVM
ncbi:MAG: VOC family protein [Cyanobacteria bacterium J06597_16]